MSRSLEVFLIFLRLGCTSFGGPVAHLGYFRDEFVSKRNWLDETAYADLVALCQFLPGPASSQVGLALGYQRGGYAGSLAAWLGFTLPSALALIAFAYGVMEYANSMTSGVLSGLKLVALAVVAQAVWGMGKSLCTDAARITFMLIATVAMLLFSSLWMQFAIIVVAAVVGAVYFKPSLAASTPTPVPTQRGTKRRASLWLLAFALLLVGLPLAANHHAVSADWLAIVDTYFRTGSLVFGGGHVVLPMLEAEVVPAGWVNEDVFLAGYGAAQAVPGPLFTFAAFLGAAGETSTTGWHGGLVAVVAIFIPSFLLVFGTLPIWQQLRQQTRIRAALNGVNAAVVGLLLAALYDPIFTRAIHDSFDVAVALTAFVALMYWRCPAWLAVILGGLFGALFL